MTIEVTFKFISINVQADFGRHWLWPSSSPLPLVPPFEEVESKSDLLLQSEFRALGQAEAQGVYLNHQGKKGSFCEVEPSWVPLP